MSIFCIPAFAQEQAPAMPREFLGWWHDYDEGIDSGIDIRSDEIVEQVKTGRKNEDICTIKFKTIRIFLEQKDVYLLTAYVCPEYGSKPLHYSYAKISERLMADVADETNKAYRHIRIFYLDCGLTKKDWDGFNPSSSWSDISGQTDRCNAPLYGQDKVPGASSFPYGRER